ncbi:MAG: EAL domain-containing protein [Bacilli bacterium]|nr:EAL domain-containing protein [Bacilli bacterium]
MIENTEKELESKKTVLIVEDEEINRNILSSIIKDDFNILIACNGQEALDSLNKYKKEIDLVLLDIFMPDIDGREILKIRQNRPDLKKIPFIVCTGERTIELECFKLGVNDFIKKPYENPEIIIARMKRMIELYEDRGIIKEVKKDKLTDLFGIEFFKKYAIEMDNKYPKMNKDLLSINITRFRLVNELYGRDFGDEVLKNIAESLKTYLNEHKGIAGRNSSDNFLLYCEHQDSYFELAESLVKHIQEMTNSSNVRIRVGVYPNVDTSLDKDIAIGRAISAANSIVGDFNRLIAVYDENYQNRVVYLEELINCFEQAIKEKQFMIYYQPKYKIQGDKNTLCSAECLVRWIHPQYGMISPGAFIPLFEENGLIRKLDNYIFEDAARQMKEWKEKYGFIVPLSVNVSRADIYNPNIVDDLLKHVDSNGIPRDKYYIEITESAYSENADQLISVVNRLRECGFKIEIYDFGSGYSSLNILTELPFDVLKIDMAFIKNVDRNYHNREIIKMIIDITKTLGVLSITEGVETQEHYDFLKEAGCDVIQGYYFSKPLPVNEFEKLLEKEFKK